MKWITFPTVPPIGKPSATDNIAGKVLELCSFNGNHAFHNKSRRKNIKFPMIIKPAMQPMNMKIFPDTLFLAVGKDMRPFCDQLYSAFVKSFIISLNTFMKLFLRFILY